MMALERWLRFEIAGRVDRAGVLLLAEHPPGLTLGADASNRDVTDPGRHRPRWVSRGGGVMLHGPGELIASLLLPVERLGLGTAALRQRWEQAAVEACGALKIAVECHKGPPGLFGRTGQVGVFGMCVERGVCSGGWQLSVADRPGMQGLVGNLARVPMSSLTRLNYRPVRPAAVREAMIAATAEQFGCDDVHVHLGHEQLRRMRR